MGQVYPWCKEGPWGIWGHDWEYLGENYIWWNFITDDTLDEPLYFSSRLYSVLELGRTVTLSRYIQRGKLAKHMLYMYLHSPCRLPFQQAATKERKKLLNPTRFCTWDFYSSNFFFYLDSRDIHIWIDSPWCESTRPSWLPVRELPRPLVHEISISPHKLEGKI